MRGGLLLFTVFAWPAAAESLSRGRVVDALTGEALALAEVRDTASPTRAAKTDREGRFTISLESAEPRLRATLIGYRPLTSPRAPVWNSRWPCSRTRSANRTASR